jgi:RIO-like serine/threonine protein kinase
MLRPSTIPVATQHGTVGCRDLARAPAWSRPIWRWLAHRELAVLDRLAGVRGIPASVRGDQGRILRSWLPGAPMQVARPRDPAYFRSALRLLRQVHRRGVAHNDLAREANWLVLADGAAGLIDFEIAWCDPRRGRAFRMLAREDLRHLLKHKRHYCPGWLTTRQNRMLAQTSLLSRAWGKIVRPLLRTLDRSAQRP